MRDEDGGEECQRLPENSQAVEYAQDAEEPQRPEHDDLERGGSKRESGDFTEWKSGALRTGNREQNKRVA